MFAGDTPVEDETLRALAARVGGDESILRTGRGIPYTAPEEVVLLFKATYLRKDVADFHRVLPAIDRRSRLTAWLSVVHPCHPWIDALATS